MDRYDNINITNIVFDNYKMENIILADLYDKHDLYDEYVIPYLTKF